eukprot:5101276-Prymnesium_polylepis.1
MTGLLGRGAGRRESAGGDRTMRVHWWGVLLRVLACRSAWEAAHHGAAAAARANGARAQAHKPLAEVHTGGTNEDVRQEDVPVEITKASKGGCCALM